MTDADPAVSHAKSWKERWTLEESLSSGGQAIAMKAKDAVGRVAFVKALRDEDQRNSTKRVRMYREIASLRAISVPEIPKLIESNADRYEDKAVALYLATEFVEGPTLGKYVADGLVSPNLAVQFAVSLADTLEVAHRYGIYHRDIKPDNIVISSRFGRIVPVVVDFGMASVAGADDDFDTSPDVEVGNRFLRLPELSAGSENKEDARSDVTFCVGLLFFMLTKRQPRVLMDEQTKRPHQRANSAALLSATGLYKDRLFAFFDTGFQEDLSRRFQTMDALRASLHRMIPLAEVLVEEPVRMSRVFEKIGMSSEREKTRRLEAMEKVFQSIKQIIYGIAQASDFVFEAYEGKRDVTSSAIKGAMGLRLRTDNVVSFEATLTTEVNGDEVLLAISGPGVSRKDFRVPISGEMLPPDKDEIESIFAQGLDIASEPERLAAINSERAAIVASVKSGARAMVESMLGAISEFVSAQDSGVMAATRSGIQVASVGLWDRRVTADGSLTARLRSDNSYVHFSCDARISFATHTADVAEMHNIQTVSLFLTRANARDAISVRLDHRGHSMEPYVPARLELRRILDDVIGKSKPEST